VDADAAAQLFAQVGCQGLELRRKGGEEKNVARATIGSVVETRIASGHRWAMRQHGPPRKRAVLPQPSRPTTICPEDDGTPAVCLRLGQHLMVETTMRFSPLAFLSFAPVVFGCTGTVAASSETVDAETTTETSALVVIERTSDAVRGTSAEASARFLRVAAPSSAVDALHAIGAALDLPPRGACASIVSLAGTAAGLSGGTAPAAHPPVVELVDVGEVSLEVDGEITRLLPRQVPDVTDVVSGVVYARGTFRPRSGGAGDVQAGPSLLPPATRYIVHVAGGHDLGAFDVAMMAPRDPTEVHIAGETAQGGLQLGSSDSVAFSWTPDGPDDLVYVDLRPDSTADVPSRLTTPPSADGAVRCVLDDAGRGVVSTLLFEDAGTMIVHRVHRERLRARGISGEVRVDFARTLLYARQ